MATGGDLWAFSAQQLENKFDKDFIKSTPHTIYHLGTYRDLAIVHGCLELICNPAKHAQGIEGTYST